MSAREEAAARAGKEGTARLSPTGVVPVRFGEDGHPKILGRQEDNWMLTAALSGFGGELYRDGGFDLGERLGVGSVGEVFAVGDTDEWIVKIVTQDLSGGFVDRGLLAERAVRAEVACGLRQIEFGPVPAWMVVRAEAGDGRVSFFEDRDEKGRLAILGPRIEGVEMDEWIRGVELDEEAVRMLVENVFDRIGAMFVPEMTGGENVNYGNFVGVANLVVDQRMRDIEEKGEGYRGEAERVNRKLTELIGELREVFEDRVGQGKFGEQHGDPRMNNILVTPENQGVVLDAVRLVKMIDGEERLMKEWFYTDIMLQAGMFLGGVLVEACREGQNGLARKVFEEGVRAYAEKFADDVFGDEELANMMGLALAYGITINIHVLNYRREGLSDEERRDLDLSWEVLERLSEDFRGWRDGGIWKKPWEMGI